jgi:cytochrome c peroxidase
MTAALAACAAPPTDPGYAWDLPAGFPTPPVPADNPMTAAKVELGRHLFYDARLSANGLQACGSCHDQARGFADGRPTSPGSTGEAGRRNAQGLANVGYLASLTWADPTMRALEDQALVPMFGTAPVELGLTGDAAPMLARLASEPVYQELFTAAFPEDPAPIAIPRVTQALASFERTLLAGRARVDRGELTPAEERGQALFSSPRLGCARCHGGFAFTVAVGDQLRFFNTGLSADDPDPGVASVTGDPEHRGRFRPPGLRNVAVTAPYLHDGSAATLEEVIDLYAAGGRGAGIDNPRKSELITGFTLTADERADLVAFLGALTDEVMMTDPALADPWR